jgi:WS/DGAT/MGAT family acyltransferase
MAQEHFDRLTAIDASFLHQEGPTSHMHVGAISLFEGPPPPYTELLDALRERLHLVPRYRQKLSVPPAASGRPLWIDDPTFNLEYHVRQTALPHPGSEEQLMLLVARIFSQQLDRSKPLWETWLVEGLDDGGFALISKTHHALIDGVAGVDLAQVIYDLGPVPTEIDHPGEPWRPAPEPTPAEVLAAGTLGLLRTGFTTAAAAAGLALRPKAALKGAREAAEGLGEVAWAGMNPAPETPLNVEIGPHRRFAGVRTQLADFRTVKNAFGGTVNDVVLTVVSGALRGWLQSRGVRTEGMELRALVPVSIRGEHEHGTGGNRIAAMRGPLPVYIDDPIARLQAVREDMGALKESKQAVGAEVLASVQNFAPPTILAQASRLNFSTRLFNLIVTNVPGPQFPLYVRGRELLDVFPIAFLPKDHALAIAIMSYNGHMNFGLLGDFDALPDIEAIADGIDASLAELLALARKAGSGARDIRSAVEV